MASSEKLLDPIGGLQEDRKADSVKGEAVGAWSTEDPDRWIGSNLAELGLDEEGLRRLVTGAEEKAGNLSHQSPSHSFQHQPFRYYVNIPLQLAAALDLSGGESVQWQLLTRLDLRLLRLDAPAPSVRRKKKVATAR